MRKSSVKQLVIYGCILLLTITWLVNVFFTKTTRPSTVSFKASTEDDQDYQFDRQQEGEVLLSDLEDDLPIDINDELLIHGQDPESKLPQLINDENEIAVAIVDEHQEVIPYWFKAVDEGLISEQGNTLIHIDGHSDMATPEDYNPLRAFKYEKDAHESSYLPLMQSNDVFIISAIMKNLINHVVWVKPSWYNQSRHTWNFKMGIGMYSQGKKQSICSCMQQKSKKKTTKSVGETKMKCSIFQREADEEVDLSIEDCKIIKHFNFVSISEDKFIKMINLQKVKRLFIDIDEDYFGVESGVQILINNGLSLETVEVVDEYLTLFNPRNVESEQQLSKKLQDLFRYVIKLKDISINEGMKLLLDEFQNLIRFDKFAYKNTHITKDDMANIMKAAPKYILSLPVKELQALSNAKFCRTSSPRLLSAESEFQLCHGTIYPEDTLNQIYVGTEAEIQKRASKMFDILQHIYQQTSPKFISVARSLRDGYTPRSQQRYIEKALLQTLDNVISKQNKKMKVIFDKQLVFGKDGWPGN